MTSCVFWHHLSRQVHARGFHPDLPVFNLCTVAWQRPPKDSLESLVFRTGVGSTVVTVSQWCVTRYVSFASETINCFVFVKKGNRSDKNSNTVMRLCSWRGRRQPIEFEFEPRLNCLEERLLKSMRLVILMRRCFQFHLRSIPLILNETIKSEWRGGNSSQLQWSWKISACGLLVFGAHVLDHILCHQT